MPLVCTFGYSQIWMHTGAHGFLFLFLSGESSLCLRLRAARDLSSPNSSGARVGHFQGRGNMSSLFRSISLFFFLSFSNFPLCLKAIILLDRKGPPQNPALTQMWVCMCV